MTQKTEPLELVHGSGNVFADFGDPNAVGEQLKARLAAEIIKAMNAQELTARQAEERTGIAASDFSRIRHVKLDRFTIDRLITILERLDTIIDLKMTVQPHTRKTALLEPTPPVQA
jgi:predicted XRE-type DNA-binding protein